MHKFFTLLYLIPVIANAQIKPTSKNTRPLIESISSDTIHGKCKVIFFEYDQLKRVTQVSDKVIEIKKGSKTKIYSEEKIIKVQNFQYRQNEQIPFARLIDYYEYDDTTGKQIGQYQEQQYFIFKNGKRIGDSTFYTGTEQQNQGIKSEDKNTTNRVAYFLQTPTKVIHVLDLSVKNPTTYMPANIYYDSFVIKKQKNIGFELTQHDEGDKFYPRAFFTFSNFDQAINPLHQLNIAALLSNEKITLSFDANEIDLNGQFSDYGSFEFNWHYLNQNNPLKYSIERGETATPFKDIIQFSYTYNQYHQPIYCKTIIKKVMNKDNDHQYEDLARTFKKSFTFKYSY